LPQFKLDRPLWVVAFLPSSITVPIWDCQKSKIIRKKLEIKKV